MLQIVVFPPEDAAAAIEPFRRLHDPAFHQVGAHVALVPPWDDGDHAAVVRKLGDFTPPGTLDVSFGAPEARGRSLALPVLDPDGRVGAFVRTLAARALPTSALVGERAVAPALRLGLFVSDAELELARRAWLAEPRPRGFRARELVLLFDDVRGLWHEARRFSLEPAP